MDLKPLTGKDHHLNNLNQNIDTGDHNNFSHWHGTGQWSSRTVRTVHPVNYFGGPNPTLTLHELTQASACLLSSGPVLPTTPSSTLQNNGLYRTTGCYERIIRVLEAYKHSNNLYSDEVISMEDMEEVQALVRGRGAKLLMDKLQKYFSAANTEQRLQIMSALSDSLRQHHQQHLIQFLNPSYLTNAVPPTSVTALKEKSNINQRISVTGPNLPVNTRRPCQITDRSFDDTHNIKMPDVITLSISEKNTTQYNRSGAQSRACEHEEISSKPGPEVRYPVQETNYDAKP